MLRQKSQFFEFLFVVTDLVVVSIAWVLAYWIRFSSQLVEVDKGIPDFSHYLSMVVFIWVIWASVFRWIGLYRPRRGVRPTLEMWELVRATALSTLLLIAVVYLFREKSVPFSRMVFLYFWGLATAFSLMQRGALRYFLRDMRRRGYNIRYLLLVGAGQVAEDIAARVRMHSELGVQLVGCLSKEGVQDTGKEGRGFSAGGIPVLGSYSELGARLVDTDIDQIIIALPLEDNHLLPVVMDQIGDSLVDVKIVPDIYRFVRIGGAIEEFEGLPVVSLQDSPIEGINLFLKRIFDLCLSGMILLLLSPVMLLLALLIKLSSRGPVFYAQERVSVDGSRFKIFKFRTMRCDAECNGPGWSKKGDPRVTWLGRVLRKYSLDELPQLFNVLRGDMSLVGPRPERPVFIEEFRKRVPRYMLRHKVPAGMTGWAQVHGWRGDTSIDRRIEFDLFYIENWSIMLDLRILILTLFSGIKDVNA